MRRGSHFFTVQNYRMHCSTTGLSAPTHSQNASWAPWPQTTPQVSKRTPRGAVQHHHEPLSCLLTELYLKDQQGSSLTQEMGLPGLVRPISADGPGAARPACSRPPRDHLLHHTLPAHTVLQAGETESHRKRDLRSGP